MRFQLFEDGTFKKWDWHSSFRWHTCVPEWLPSEYNSDDWRLTEGEWSFEKTYLQRTGNLIFSFPNTNYNDIELRIRILSNEIIKVDRYEVIFQSFYSEDVIFDNGFFAGEEIFSDTYNNQPIPEGVTYQNVYIDAIFRRQSVIH